MKQFIPGRGKRDTNDTKVNSLWTVSTVFPSLAERKIKMYRWVFVIKETNRV